MEIYVKESDVKERVKTALEALGWEITVFSWNRKMPLGLKGVADYFATHAGHKKQVWIELKRPGETLTPDQDRWLTRTAASGALCIVVRSVDELIEKLTEMGCM